MFSLILDGQASLLLRCSEDLHFGSGYVCAACNTAGEQKTGFATQNLLPVVRGINIGVEAWEEVNTKKVVMTIVTDKSHRPSGLRASAVGLLLDSGFTENEFSRGL